MSLVIIIIGELILLVTAIRMAQITFYGVSGDHGTISLIMVIVTAVGGITTAILILHYIMTYPISP